jgi:hypothetical protein
MRYEEEKYIYATISEWRKLKGLLSEYFKLEGIDKIATLTGFAVAIGCSFGIGICLVTCLCNGIVSILSTYIDEPLSHFILAGVLLLTILIIISARKYLFINPIVRKLVKNVFGNNK